MLNKENKLKSLENIVPKESNLPFYALLFFTFIVYIAPQEYFPFLKPLYLAKIFAIFAALTYVFNTLGKGKPIFKLDTEIRLLLTIVVIAILSIPFSLWPGGSFNTLINLYLKVIIIFLLISSLLNSMSRIKTMLWFIMLYCTFIAVVAIKNFYTGNFYESVRIYGAASGMAMNPNDLALTILVILPFSFSIFIISKKKIGKLFSLAYVLLGTIAIILTFSRAGFIGLLVAYGLCFLKMVKRSGLKIVVLTLVLLIIVFIIFPEGYTDRIASIFDSSKDSTGSSIERRESTIKGFQVMLEHPILGVGLGMNILALNEKGMYWQMIHNVYLQIGSELGITALVIFIILFGKLIINMRVIQKDFKKSGKNENLSLLAQATEISLIAFAVVAIFYPVAYHFYFYYVAGFAVAIKRVAYGNTDYIKDDMS